MLKSVSSSVNAIGALNYVGTWNASTNTPTLVSGTGTKGDYYVVSVAGSTSLNGISNTPAGNIAATTVQAAINELDSEKLSASATALPSSFASASINSVTPTGGTLAIASGAVKLDDAQTLFWGAGSSYILGSSASGFLRFYTGSSLRGGFDSAGLSVTGLTTTDTLRVNVTPTAETPTATHTAVFNINGTNYKFLCLVA